MNLTDRQRLLHLKNLCIWCERPTGSLSKNGSGPLDCQACRYGGQPTKALPSFNKGAGNAGVGSEYRRRMGR
jgi:hypothetical protein